MDVLKSFHFPVLVSVLHLACKLQTTTLQVKIVLSDRINTAKSRTLSSSVCVFYKSAMSKSEKENVVLEILNKAVSSRAEPSHHKTQAMLGLPNLEVTG